VTEEGLRLRDSRIAIQVHVFSLCSSARHSNHLHLFSLTPTTETILFSLPLLPLLFSYFNGQDHKPHNTANWAQKPSLFYGGETLCSSAIPSSKNRHLCSSAITPSRDRQLICILFALDGLQSKCMNTNIYWNKRRMRKSTAENTKMEGKTKWKL